MRDDRIARLKSWVGLPLAVLALGAGCDMGLVCNDRAAAELALTALQRRQVTPPARLARMRGRAHACTEYRQAPRWLTAVAALRAAQLLD